MKFPKVKKAGKNIKKTYKKMEKGKETLRKKYPGFFKSMENTHF